MDNPIRSAAAKMAKRLEFFKRTAEQARERGLDVSDQPVGEMWEPDDEAALKAFDQAVQEIEGVQQELFLEEAM